MRWPFEWHDGALSGEEAAVGMKLPPHTRTLVPHPQLKLISNYIKAGFYFFLSIFACFLRMQLHQLQLATAQLRGRAGTAWSVCDHT